MRYPLDNFTVSQGYHAGHQAIDLTSPTGTPIKSPVTGSVIAKGYDRYPDGRPRGGNYVIVREDSPNRYEYYMGHNSATHVNVGQRVTEGQHIADVGMTGQATGPHVHFQIRQYNYGALLNPITVYNNYNPSGGGSTMNDDTARQMGYHYLGRNGFDGAGNALASGAPDLIGRPLTNQAISEIFLSAESRQWRDVKLPSVFAERNNLRAENANLKEQNTRLKSDVASANAQRDTAIEEKNLMQVEKDKALAENADLKAQNESLKTTVDAQAKRIAELEADNGGDVTVNFNFIGQLCWSLIQVIGIKRKEG